MGLKFFGSKIRSGQVFKGYQMAEDKRAAAGAAAQKLALAKSKVDLQLKTFQQQQETKNIGVVTSADKMISDFTEKTGKGMPYAAMPQPVRDIYATYNMPVSLPGGGFGWLKKADLNKFDEPIRKSILDGKTNVEELEDPQIDRILTRQGFVWKNPNERKNHIAKLKGHFTRYNALSILKGENDWRLSNEHTNKANPVTLVNATTGRSLGVIVSTGIKDPVAALSKRLNLKPDDIYGKVDPRYADSLVLENIERDYMNILKVGDPKIIQAFREQILESPKIKNMYKNMESTQHMPLRSMELSPNNRISMPLMDRSLLEPFPGLVQHYGGKVNHPSKNDIL